MELSTSITDWYKNETIFLTGGSGYIGKGVIYKLLQCGTSKIYVLIRTKKGQNPEERVDLLAKHFIFDPLRAKGIDVRSKLIAIAGDVTLPQLGISEKDRTLLQKDVTVFIHTAASIRFDDPLKTAVFFNLRSARDVVELAKGIDKLKILHHVSTEFSNMDEITKSKTIMEKVYTPPMDWRKLIEFVETAPDELINAMEAKVIDSHLSTYFFTKHLAECVVKEAAGYIPVTISRPGIVMCAEKEPEPGWIDSANSVLMLIAGAAKGVIRVVHGNQNSRKAYTTLDCAVNMILVSSWDEAMVKRGIADDQVKVFNGDCYHMTLDNFLDFGRKTLKTTPMANALWQMRIHCTANPHLFLIYHLIEHLLPGMFFDLLLVLTGNKPQLVKIYRRFYTAMFTLFPLWTMDDNFDITNYNNLKRRVPDSDSKMFDMNIPNNPEKVLQYTVTGMTGIRKFLGDPPLPSDKDFVHQKRLYWLDKGFMAFLAILFWWLVPLRLIAGPLFYIADSTMSLFE